MCGGKKLIIVGVMIPLLFSFYNLTAAFSPLTAKRAKAGVSVFRCTRFPVKFVFIDHSFCVGSDKCFLQARFPVNALFINDYQAITNGEISCFFKP